MHPLLEFRREFSGKTLLLPDRGPIRPHKTKIRVTADQELPGDQQAGVEKHGVVDGVLRDMGYSGATMGDRLKQLNRDRLRSLDSVWEAHKLRNRIAHEMDQVLTYQEARRAVMLYEAALRELGYLQE